ncbi:MAG: NUDIX hydrolase [Maritimibacter sp.]|nr:NUDIX hydrolase [Maritimibacter sp.]
MDIASATHHVGAKVALICGPDLVAYLRDDFAHIPDPGLWDLPGGEREPGETALACARRETREEFAIDFAPEAVVYAADYRSHQPGRADVAFFVARIDPGAVANIRFGDEGQEWRMMPVDAFIHRADAVKELRDALARFLASPEGHGVTALSR